MGGLTIEIPESISDLSREALLSLPIVHPDGSVTAEGSRDDWIIVNTTISDFEKLVDIFDLTTVS